MLIKNILSMWQLKRLETRISKLHAKRVDLILALLADDMLPAKYLDNTGQPVMPEEPKAEHSAHDVRIISRNIDDESIMMQAGVNVIPAKVGQAVKHIPLGNAKLDVVGQRFTVTTTDGRTFSCGG